MKKTIFLMHVTALMVSFLTPKVIGEEIAKEKNSVLNGVSEKTKEIVHSVKEGIEHKSHDFHMKSAQLAKERAEKKAHDLQIASEEAAFHSLEAAERAKKIAAVVEAEQKAIAEQEKNRKPNQFLYKDTAQKKYENYLRSAQRAKEKAEKEAFDYELKSKNAAQQAREAAQNASMIAKHIELEQKSHDLHEKFEEATKDFK